MKSSSIPLRSRVEHDSRYGAAVRAASQAGRDVVQSWWSKKSGVDKKSTASRGKKRRRDVVRSSKLSKLPKKKPAMAGVPTVRCWCLKLARMTAVEVGEKAGIGKNDGCSFGRGMAGRKEGALAGPAVSCRRCCCC